MESKLGFAVNSVNEFKIGKSFEKNERTSFHTFRYDFMPASLDTTKRATVDIGDGHQVTVTVPHIEGAGTSNTVFKGSKKPYQKECVLVIDHATGEITLEKLTYNVQLKKTRAEGSSRVKSNPPIENNFVSKKSPSNQKLSPQQRPSTYERSTPLQKCSPLPKSPVSSQPSPNGSCSNHSMPSLNILASKPPVFMEAPAIHISNENAMDVPEVGVLSSSSSSNEDDSSASSDMSDNEGGVQQEMPKTLGLPNRVSDSPKKKDLPNTHSPNGMLSLPSMPKFSLLSEDLKLSESDSDSDG